MQIIKRANLSAGMQVADVPAGGGYLKKYLPANVSWLPFESCQGFQSTQSVSPNNATRAAQLPWADASVDALLSIAGIHHIEDKKPLFNEFFRVVKPGGQIVISDVAENSPAAKFLDGFVDAHNSTGHQGAYLNQHTLQTLADCGWQIRSAEHVPFFWKFTHPGDMANFCHGLFDICHATIAQTQDALTHNFEVVALPDGQTGLPWSLMTIVAEKPVHTSTSAIMD